MRKRFTRLIISTAAFLLLAVITPASANSLSRGFSKPSFSASDVISQINAYRAANGLGTLSYNATLASLAQAHSEFMAATGSITHYENGTTPSDRAYAAGYGDGNTIILSEIIYGGWNADVSDAMTWWKNSSVHNGVMLDSRYVEIGAGVATDGTTNYFTAEIAYVTGYSASSSSGSSSSDSGDSSSDSSDDTGSDDTVVYSPVIMATPMEDGSIIHTVESGQTLWTIAAVYDVDLETIYELNNMNSSSYVYIGDQIIIRGPGEYPSETVEPDPDSTPQPPREENEEEAVIGEALSVAPLQYFTPLPTVASSTTSSTTDLSALPTLSIGTQDQPIIEGSTARWMVIIAFIVIFGAVIGSFALQKPADRPPPDDVI